MNDDLLIRFIDGNTTPEETEFVINELSQDGEAAKEWMQMLQGARMSGTEPLQDILPTDVISRTLTEKSAKNQQKKVVILPWIISGVSAVAASIAIIAAVLMTPNKTEVPQNLVADSGDSVEVIYESDTLTVKTSLNVKETFQESMADARIVLPEENRQSDMDDKVIDKAVKRDEITDKKIVKGSSTASALKNNEIFFEMLKPAKTPYRVKVRNIEKEFIFEWMTNASEVSISIIDGKGSTIIREDNFSGNLYSVAAYDLVNRGVLEWKVEATFNDGTVRIKSGSIELVY